MRVFCRAVHLGVGLASSYPYQRRTPDDESGEHDVRQQCLPSWGPCDSELQLVSYRCDL